MDMHNNIQIFFLCRMTYSHNLDKNFDGVKDMETSQKKRHLAMYA